MATSASASQNGFHHPAPQAVAGRLVALDVFRGLTVAAMILVNNPGSRSAVYAPLRHSPWHGCTLTDLVFPFFLFALGMSTSLSCEARRRRGLSRRHIVGHVVLRTLALASIGMVLNGLFYFPWDSLRFPGVLQRIAVVYLLTSVAVLLAGQRVRISLCLAILLIYWAVLTMLPTPGHSAGDLTPEGNLAAVLDRYVFGRHLWHGGPCDPEGILSTMPATATALLGSLTTDLLRGPGRRVASARLILAGAIGALAGALWGLVFPINKNLWTSSYAAFTAGLAALVFGLCCWALEEQGWRKWARAFECFGANPLILYVASEIVGMWLLRDARHFFYRRLTDSEVLRQVPGYALYWATGPVLSPAAASLGWSLLYVGLWGTVAWIMYRKTIFLKL